MTVPAYEALWSGEDFVSQHYRRYTRGSLLAALRGAGLRPIWASYFNTLLFPAVVGAILGMRLTCPRAMYRSNVRELPGRINTLFCRVFAAERHLLRWVMFPVGASVLAVAEVW